MLVVCNFDYRFQYYVFILKLSSLDFIRTKVNKLIKSCG